MIQAGGLVHPIRCKQCGTPGKVFSNSQLLERNKHLWQVYLSTLMECKTRQASSAWQGTTMLPSMCMRAVSSEFGFRFVSQTCIGKEFKSLNFSWKKELKGCKGRSCHPGTSSQNWCHKVGSSFTFSSHAMIQRYFVGPGRAWSFVQLQRRRPCGAGP